MRALFHHTCGSWLRERLAQFQTDAISVDIVSAPSGSELDRALAGADVILHVLYPVTESMMAKAPRLKLIQKIGVGLDAIALDAAKARNIAVCNMPGTNTQAVAEMTLGLMLSVLRGIPSLNNDLRRSGNWALSPEAQAKFGEISGKVVGLVGYGQVAKRLERILDALDAEILVCNWSEVEPRIGTFVDKATLLKRSDIISLHIPATPETGSWLDAEAIGQMKQGAIVVNTARGSLIDEAAMAKALHTGRLAGAGLDVFAHEPVEQTAPILSAPNVVVLPHLAWLTRETLERSLTAAHDNMIRLLRGQPLLNRHQ